MKACFQWVKDYAVIQDDETQVVLSHYPIAHWYNQYRGAVHLYGHVHNTKDYQAFLQYAQICKNLAIPLKAITWAVCSIIWTTPPEHLMI